jgi:hypothetical protein
LNGVLETGGRSKMDKCLTFSTYLFLFIYFSLLSIYTRVLWKGKRFGNHHNKETFVPQDEYDQAAKKEKVIFLLLFNVLLRRRGTGVFPCFTKRDPGPPKGAPYRVARPATMLRFSPIM